MAKIYESAGEQVAITGPSRTTGFSPTQAYDPTQQFLRAAEFQNRNQAIQFEALAQFSSTLTEFTKKKAEEYIEQEKNLGAIDVLNGTTELDPAFRRQQQADALLLKTAAEADNAVANDLETRGQLDLATEFKERSKAISGWRRYGQAIQFTKNLAANYQPFLAEFMEKAEAIIPLPDGRVIAPVQASTRSEIEAVLEVAQQQYTQQYGIGRINPAIVAEHLAPTAQAVRGQIASNKLSEGIRKNRETAISDITGQIKAEVSNPDLDTPALAESFQRYALDLQLKGGLSRGEASDKVVADMLNAFTTLPKDVADGLIDRLSQVPKIANDPNSITLGAAYGDLFKKAQGIVDDEETERLAQLEKQQEQRAQETFNILEKARQDANVPAAELQALKNQVVADLGLLADQGSETALRLRGELLAEPPNVDYTLYRQYREGIAQGLRPSAAQIEADVQKGLLSPQMAEELKVYATGSDREDFMKQFGSSFKEAITSHLKQAGAISLNPFGQPLQHTQHVNQTINDLADSVYKVYDAERRKGNKLEDQDINQLIENLIPRTVGRYFQQDPATKSWTTRQISRDPALSPDRVRTTLGTYVPDAGGFDPRTIQIRRYDAGTSRQLTKPEVEDNIRRLQNGQPPTARAAALAASTPNGLLPLLTNQARLNGVDPAPILSSPQAQQFAEFRAVAPRATDSLARSTDYRSQLLQLRRITEAQQRAQRLRELDNAPGPAVDLQPGARVGMREYIQLGLSQGLSPEQAILMGAVGMAESAGDSGVVRNRPDTGDLSYGMWQINMLGNLGPARLRQFGLRSADDLKDPETNAKAMAALLRSSGATTWGSYNDKRYLQYMSEARKVYSQLQSQGSNSSGGGRANFTPTNVQSIRIETPGNSFQPGMDLWFADKQFGAVLPGRVKEIRMNNGNYGNMIVVESIDTKTGQPVDVIYAHLDSISVKEGQKIAPGTVLGRQGGTGRVRSADGTIASIDFLAPAPRGSNSMTAYPRWQQLAQEIKTRIESGSFR